MQPNREKIFEYFEEQNTYSTPGSSTKEYMF